MKISINIPEDTAVFFYLRDLYDNSHANGETLKEYIADYIRETIFNDDKAVDEAVSYVAEHAEAILTKHPEDAISLVEYLED